MDLDGDGHRDILSGSYSRSGEGGMAGLFQVLYGKPDGTFRKAEALKGTDDEPLIVPATDEDEDLEKKICTRPFAVDWDGDGDLDLVVGNFAGTLYWFRGEGKGRDKFAPKPELIQAGDDPLKVTGHHSDPFAIDWDGDGDLDLLSGSANGGVQWSENIAGKAKVPRLRPFQFLIQPAATGETSPVFEDDLTGPTTSTRIWVADINGDGKLDVLVGDSVTVASPAEGANKDKVKKMYAIWKKAAAKAEKLLEAETVDVEEAAKAESAATRIHDQLTQFMEEEDTGFVWLYLQK